MPEFSKLTVYVDESGNHGAVSLRVSSLKPRSLGLGPQMLPPSMGKKKQYATVIHCCALPTAHSQSVFRYVSDPEVRQAVGQMPRNACTQVRLTVSTVRLSQRLRVGLFDVAVPTINEHLQGIYEEAKLEPEATIRKFRIVQIEVNRSKNGMVGHYPPASLAA